MNPPNVDPHGLAGTGLRSVHLIGVAGSGMSGLAALLLAFGHRVSGSDKVDTSEVKRLVGEGLLFHCPHEAHLVREVDVVIYSSAVKAGNPAYDESIRLGKPLLRRAEALAALMTGRKGIVVAGMHGKTTTSSMAAHALRASNLRPSHYVGAEIPILGTNAHLDPHGEYFVAEGDESDGTVALFHPEHTILLNVEEEHLDFYEDLAAIEAVFNRLLAQTRGKTFYCIDDANAARLCSEKIGGVSYGAGAAADYRYGEPRQTQFQSVFEVFRRGELLGTAKLNVPGRHNVSNATCVIALSLELGVDFAVACEALESFRGARRRFEFKHRGPHYAIVDDYGHHPSEISATLATARAGHDGRIIAMFQPHRYTRTQALAASFGRAFVHADVVVVTDVYPAGEQPIPGVTGQTVVSALQANGHAQAFYEPRFERLTAAVGGRLEPGDLVVSLGAGNIHEAGARLAHDVKVLEAIDVLLQGRGSASLYEPLSKHTTLRVGGPARYWVEPNTEGAFVDLVKFGLAKNLPIFVVGRGSNLLVRDGGIDGLVIHPNGGEFAEVSTDPERCEITAGAAVGFKRLAGAAAKAGIGGFEWMEGIPGAVGGSLRMNAGAMGVETFSQVVSVRVVDALGNVHERKPEELEIGYRHVASLQQQYALRASFRGHPSSPESIRELMEASTLKRKRSQPIAASAGCIFKNPAKDCPAGRLIQELGLKNLQVGAARVSEIHGNFIVNDGGASASEVLLLIEQIKSKAWTTRGIRIETEVQIVGQD